MTEFEPHIGRARLTKTSASEAHARAAVAQIMRVKPWQVTVSARVGGGFNMVLPASYLPSKHDGKLNEVAETVIGEPGWYAKFDGRTRKGALVPGTLPTFPPTVPHPLDRSIKAEVHTRFDPARGQWGRIPIGVLLAKPGGPDKQVVRTEFDTNPAMQISGIAGSGKGQLIMSLITARWHTAGRSGWSMR